MSIIGTRVLRKEDPRFLTGEAAYVSDLDDPRLDGAAHVCFVRATVAGASIDSVLVSRALEVPGVLGVVAAGDVEGIGAVPPELAMFPEPMMSRPWLAGDVARFAGEPVAAVVAATPYAAADGAEAVEVHYGTGADPSPVVDLEAAARDETVLFAAAGTNVACDFAAAGMATGFSGDDFFDGCDVVVRERLVNSKLAPVPMEGRSVACCWEGGRLVAWVSCQVPHGARAGLCKVYGLDEGDCRVIVPDVGGGFGQKLGGTPEELFLPWLARRFGRPMRWTETRTENLTGIGHGRAQVQHVAIGGDADGTVRRYRLDVLGDSGAYAGLGAFLPYFTHVMAPGTYAIERAETACRSVVTSTAPTLAYRGAGRPEAAAAIERAMDLFAARCGLDPVEVRARNLVGAGSFPCTTAVGTEYDSGDYRRALDAAVAAAGYDGLRAEQRRRREAGERLLLGIGVSCYVEITAGPAPGGSEFAEVEITPSGGARVFSGSFSHGQGHATTFAMVAADRLGIPLESVEIVQGDTDLVASGVGTFGSRSLQLGGSAVGEASARVVEAAREVAAGLLEASAADVTFDAARGAFHVAGAPAVSVGWAELAGESAARAGEPLSADCDYSGGASYPFGAHVAVVEVDVETGGVRLARMVTCDDSGPLLNPVIVEGQRHGGIAQGVAQTLLEEVRYDAWGNPVTANLADYAFISAAELPSFELEVTTTPSPQNALGVKGIGESGTIGATPAAQSAVVDALSHLGVRHVDLPCTPQRVWRAIAAARDGGGPAAVSDR